MANLILNKLKTIDNSRLTLKSVLESKGVNTGNIESLDSLISKVGELNKYDPHIDDEEFTGVPEEPVPDYYKGDDDWKDLIDLKSIVENDTEEGYPGKAIFFFRMSDNPELILTSPGDILRGFNAYRFSDNPNTTTTTLAHTWDSSKDITPQGSNERFRWIIAYSNMNPNAYVSDWNRVQGFNGYKFLPEAVIYYKGRFGRVICQDGYCDFGNSNTMNRYWKCPKYFEVTSDCYICAVGEYENLYNYPSTEMTLGGNQMDYRLRTCILNCSIAKGINPMALARLEYFEMNNPDAEYGWYYTTRSTGSSSPYTYYYCVQSAIMRLPNRIRNSEVRTYFNLKNHGHRLAFTQTNVKKTMNTNFDSSYLNDTWTYTDGSTDATIFHLPSVCSNVFMIANNLDVICRCRYNDNFDIKVTNRVQKIKDEAFRYNTHTKTEIKLVQGTLYNRAFWSGETQSTTELDDHNYLRIDTIHNTTINYTAVWKYIMYPVLKMTGNCNFGYAAFAYSRLKKLDMSEATVTFNFSNSPSQGQDQYDMNWRPSMHPRDYYTGDDVNSYNQSLSGLEYLEELWLPKCTDLPQYFICGFPNLEKVVINTTQKRLRNYCISYNPKLREIVNNSEQLNNIGSYAFAFNRNLQSLVIVGDTLQSLGTGICQGDYSLKSLSLPLNLITIPESMCNSCESLERINIPERVMTYGTYAFSMCSSLKKVFQVNNGKPLTINNYCFNGCSSLEEIPDMSNVQVLGDYVFKWCNSLVLKPFKASVTHSGNAYKVTASQIVLDENYNIPSLNVSGASWTIQKFLNFLESLPDRTGEDAYSIQLGADINYCKNDDGSYSQAFYPLMSQFYVVEGQDGHLIFIDDGSVQGAIQISDYVASKNWILS